MSERTQCPGVWIFGNFAEAILVLVTGLTGHYIAAILTGELDVMELLTRRRSQ